MSKRSHKCRYAFDRRSPKGKRLIFKCVAGGHKGSWSQRSITVKKWNRMTTGGSK